MLSPPHPSSSLSSASFLHSLLFIWGGGTVRNTVSWLEGCQRGLACGLDAGKCQHIFTFHLSFGTSTSDKKENLKIEFKKKQGGAAGPLLSVESVQSTHSCIVTYLSVNTHTHLRILLLTTMANPTWSPCVQTLTSLIKDTLPLFILPRLQFLWVASYKAFNGLRSEKLKCCVCVCLPGSLRH